MTRVIHTGDTHLGYQQYHSPARREDFLAAFRQVVEDAVEADVDAVVHAGDLFHDRRPDLPDLLGTLSVLGELAEAGIPFLAVVGNHETKRDAQWLDLFESLGLATRLGSEPVVVDDTAFYGMDFVPRSRRDDLDYDFASHDADHAALVAHGLFEPFDLGDWDAGEVLSEATVAFDAMLLGDNHTPQTKQLDGSWLTYCGSTERTGADERAERGYNLATFDGDGVTITRRGLSTREFRFVDVELAAGEGLDRVRERVGQHDLSDAVVIVTIDGDGEPVAPAHVEEFIDEQGALVARVTDRREASEDDEIEVSFADPDDAVRERVRKLGLSPAARDLDETIRASKVADSNVAAEVEGHVRDLVDDGDPSTFESASAPPDPDTGTEASGDTEADTAADTTTEDEADATTDDGESVSPSGADPEADSESTGAASAGENEGDETGEETAETETVAEPETEAEAETETVTDDEETETATDEEETVTDDGETETEAVASSSDGQASMGDYV